MEIEGRVKRWQMNSTTEMVILLPYTSPMRLSPLRHPPAERLPSTHARLGF
jgi:hypothetical protein